MSTQKEFIERFRKNKYKIGSEKEDIELMKQDLQNSISQLAEDLYSDGIHFVLELIQNADDNKYRNSDHPLLKFVIDEEKILVQNNEIGFTDENVVSLCSVGKSKKTKEQGYIGEKGIGFKSVFRITNEPHIFSNGFKFQFKREDKEYGLGYIVPYWLETIPSFIDEKLTNILLPLSDEAKELLYKFDEIEPELLIFLRKLSVIEIDNRVNNTFYTFTKSEENAVVKINGNGRETCFKLISRILDVPEIAKEEKRTISKTEMILGFPLNEDGTAKTHSEQKVFAFLPTKNYGFKFMIQADFLVPANREVVHTDKKWNRWLRDNISLVFSESVEIFKKDINLSTNFYKYIPTESDITDELFSKVVEQIKNKLLDSDCILTESAKWVKPSQVFRASEEIRSLISNDDLLEFFGKEYISREVESNVDKKTLNFLEITDFALSNLLEVLKNGAWLEKQSDDWLNELYDYLKSQLNKNELDIFKEFKLVRLENGVMVSPTQTKPFFPFGRDQVYGFESQIPFIKRELLKSKEFLQSLGVFNPQPFEIIENYILKDFENTDENTNWKSKTEDVRIGYIKYIKTNLENYKSAKGKIDRLKDNIRIKLKDNKFWFPNKIYLPKEYGNTYDLEFLLSGIASIHFVHPQYIELDQKEIVNTELDENKRIEKLSKIEEEWKSFFVTLGVETKPRIDGDQTNYYSPIINSILLESNTKKNHILLSILDYEWNFYKNYSTKLVTYRPYRSRSYSTKYEFTDWYTKIVNSKWILTTKGQLEAPLNVFLDKPETRDVLGDTVLYLAAKIKNEDLIRALNINSKVKVETILKALKYLVFIKSDDKERFEKLYSFLNENYKGSEFQITKYFQGENSIFIPGISNKYVSSKEAIWRDKSDILGEYGIYLENHYPKLKDFFVQKLEVTEKPNAKNYADVLAQISKKDPIEKSDEGKIIKIYKELNKFLKIESSKEQSIIELNWWKEFITKNVFWTNKFDFRSNINVLVNDDKELYELFRDKSEIAFLNIPQNENPILAPFFRKTGLKYLCGEVKTEIVHSVDFVELKKLTEQIRELLIFIIRYLYQEENEIYEAAKQDGRILQLIELAAYGVEELSVKYSLGNELAYGNNQLFLDKNILYVRIDNFYCIDNFRDFDHISIELAKIFSQPKGLSDYIEVLFSKTSKENREKSLATKKIGNLPKEEFEWLTKKMSQTTHIETFSLVLDEFGTSDKTLPGEDFLSQNNLPSKHFPADLEYPDSYQNNTEADTNQNETKPVGNGLQNEISRTDSLEENQVLSSEVEDIVRNDWIPEIAPSEVNLSTSEDIIPEFKPSSSLTSLNLQINSKNTSSQKERSGNGKDDLSQEAKMKIGRWGEEFVVEKLKQKFLSKYSNCTLQESESGFNILVDNQIKVDVNWLNKFGENGIGRDIDYTENGKKYFIEVKATKTETKDIFHISRNEWQLAKNEQEYYSIVRVYKAGTAEARLEEIANPYKQWLEENLSVQSLTVRM